MSEPLFKLTGPRYACVMTDTTTLYSARIADGSLHADPAQEAVLPEFDRIHAAMTTPVKRGLFRKPPEPPKGLYLWGGVGRGKSMLMDLFIEFLRKRRYPQGAFSCVYAGGSCRNACGAATRCK